ncbi:MAG: right-handed parallel beta-helix repeat-containing protein [Thermoproteota archaeon]|nr:right-handed parallel beta-helix repeat-containing protein [Thermoproteota archaeon]
MSLLLLVVPLTITFSIVIWNMYLPMSSHRNTEFLNYIDYLFVNYYKHNSFVQQYIDKPLVKPIENSFNGLAADNGNYKQISNELGPRQMQDNNTNHHVTLTFYVENGNQQRLLDLLDLLDHYGVNKAVFFFEKKYMDEHEFVIKRIQDSGYLVKPWSNLSEYDRNYKPTIYRNMALIQSEILSNVSKDSIASHFLDVALHYQYSSNVAFTPKIMSHKIILEELLKENGNSLIFVDSNKTKTLNTTDQNQSNRISYSPYLEIPTGIWTMETLQKKYPSMISHLGSNDGFLVSKSIIIGKEAELKILNSKVFLETSSGTVKTPLFIEILGKGLLRNSTVTSWDPVTHMPNPDPYHPRPFLIVTHGGKMDILNSTLTHLGYSRGGITDTRFARAAVEYYNTNNFVIANSTIAFNYYGFYSVNASNFKIIGNNIYGQTGYALDPHTGSRNFIIDSNHIHDNGNQGIICSIECKNVRITNNLVDHNIEGIGLHWLTNSSVVRDNVVRYNEKYGIFIQKHSFNNIVENNTVTDNMKGIGLLEGSNSNTITNNIIANNLVAEPIHISPDSKLNIINGNFFQSK